MSELTDSQSGDALWDAITWYAFVDGLMTQVEGNEAPKGAYTIFAAPGHGNDPMAFARPGKDPSGGV